MSQAAQRGLQSGEHLLFRPQGQPEALLGREVTSGADGQPVVAKERKPGCVVVPKPVSESWARSYSEGLKQVANLDAELPAIVALHAKYGAEAWVQVQVNNTQRIDADIQGGCGARFVSSVRVGTGTRRVGTREQMGGNVGAGSGQATLGSGASSEQHQAEELSWGVAQAWSFAVTGSEQGRAIALNAQMPTELVDGASYALQVTPDRPLWLIVYYEEASGAVGKLLPNMQHKQIAVTAGQTSQLPELAVSLRAPGVAAHEWLHIIAFDAPEYAARFAPPRGAASPQQMLEWHQALPLQLDTIGQRHYKVEKVGYVITPKSAQPAVAASPSAAVQP